MKFPDFPVRQVHLDFHTSPDVPGVGADWDADHFVATLQSAHVNSITVFAKCHHGMNYYPTQIGPVHPDAHVRSARRADRGLPQGRHSLPDLYLGCMGCFGGGAPPRVAADRCRWPADRSWTA